MSKKKDFTLILDIFYVKFTWTNVDQLSKKLSKKLGLTSVLGKKNLYYQEKIDIIESSGSPVIQLPKLWGNICQTCANQAP